MNTSPFQPQAVGRAEKRVEGRSKVTGAATYTADVQLQNLAHAVFATSTIARGRILDLDDRSAAAAPGVLAVFTHLNLPRLALQPKQGGRQAPGMSFAPLQGPEIILAAQPVALVVAETIEQARHAATLLRVRYEEQAPTTDWRGATAQVYQPEKAGFVEGYTRRGEPERAWAEAPVKLERTYEVPFYHHNPIETCATVAVWEGDQLTLHDTTQGTAGTRRVAAEQLGVAEDRVRVIARFVGGGFGVKSASWPHTAFAAQAARALGRPVKLVLSRAQMYSAVGLREAAQHHLQLGASSDGRLSVIRHTKLNPTSMVDDWSEHAGVVMSMLYAHDHFENRHRMVHTNTHSGMPMRAPGEAPGLFVLESALDELAYELKLDPIELRRRNHADLHPVDGLPWSSKSLRECYARGAEMIGWGQREPEAGRTRDGDWLIGLGMASATYPVYPAEAAAASVRLFADGRAVVRNGGTDIGTGAYTIIAQSAAEGLGVLTERMRVELGTATCPSAVNREARPEPSAPARRPTWRAPSCAGSSSPWPRRTSTAPCTGFRPRRSTCRRER